VFEGIVIKRQGAGVRETCHRAQELASALASSALSRSIRPRSKRSHVISIGDVNRAKLYYHARQDR